MVEKITFVAVAFRVKWQFWQVDALRMHPIRSAQTWEHRNRYRRPR